MHPKVFQFQYHPYLVEYILLIFQIISTTNLRTHRTNLYDLLVIPYLIIYYKFQLILINYYIILSIYRFHPTSL